ncbi:hypothetical protein RU95_GL003155 [Enterococcus avium]|nr:hypothetical protein RU95_GL003155 [Enterococcus avium]
MRTQTTAKNEPIIVPKMKFTIVLTSFFNKIRKKSTLPAFSLYFYHNCIMLLLE